MLKFIPLVFLTVAFQNVIAQVPVGYYNNAYNGAVPKTCADLKTALFNIVSTDTDYVAYNSADGSYDTQNGVNNFDLHRNDDNTADIVWDMYTDNPTGPELYSFDTVADECTSNFQPIIGFCYNREHAYPRAWFGDDFHIRGDLHNIFATDGETNARHANWPYGDVANASWTSPAGAKLGSSNTAVTGYNGTVFEVIDEYKGDFARVMFYMVTAYEGFMPAWKNVSTADSVLDGTTWPSLDSWALKQWYKWHIQDPVSQKEISRNDSVFSVQGNRNPFIDHPEFVALIWQCTGLVPVTITDFTAAKNVSDVVLQWNVTMETNFKHYEVERSIDGVSFNLIGVIAAQNKPVYNLPDVNVPDVRTVFYRLKMVDRDGHFTYSKTVSVNLNRKNRDITVYPNPAVNEINISLLQSLPTGSVIKITDIAGRELIVQKNVAGQQNIKVKVNKLPAGKYFISVFSNSDVLNDAFMIMK